MDKKALALQRGTAVKGLLGTKPETKNLGQLAAALEADLVAAKKLRFHLQKRVPDTNGKLASHEPLSYELCKRIADFFGKQPSDVYIERLPEEEEGYVPPPPEKKKKKKKAGAKKAVRTPPASAAPEATPAATVTIPKFGILNQPVETRLIHAKKGFFVEIRVKVTLEQLRHAIG